MNYNFLLITDKRENYGEYSKSPIIHLSIGETASSQCGKLIKNQGQKTVFSKENLDLISCQDCLDAATLLLVEQEKRA